VKSWILFCQDLFESQLKKKSADSKNKFYCLLQSLWRIRLMEINWRIVLFIFVKVIWLLYFISGSEFTFDIYINHFWRKMHKSHFLAHTGGQLSWSLANKTSSVSPQHFHTYMGLPPSPYFRRFWPTKSFHFSFTCR